MSETSINPAELPEPWRRSSAPLAPLTAPAPTGNRYEPYPAFPVAAGSIAAGFDAIADRVLGSEAEAIRIDGYVGVFWDHFAQRLDEALKRRGARVGWGDVRRAMKSPEQIDRLIEPFVGGDDPVFGRRCEAQLIEFFDPERLRALADGHDGSTERTIYFGCGAALVDVPGPVMYVDLPKNELQYRSAAGAVCNLGAAAPEPPKAQYKRFYFVDWPALNRHKRQLAGRVDRYIDEQHPDQPASAAGATVEQALRAMSESYFRPRPWMSPGAWGGQWLKQRMPRIAAETPNIAWSFELIAPENGLMFNDGGYLLELSLDWLLFQQPGAVLGDCADWFGHAFPIRFDFLDTVGGGNLSVQCHPAPDYIRRHFGETFTQDETYYILDREEGAEVYLGFRAGVDPDDFGAALRASHERAEPLDVRRYVQTVPARKHGLYLIPHGTVHCSGRNNLVLEISATPYIFTFKMYDWMRLDLDGRPRPLNIEHGLANLRFERQGERVSRELVSRPVSLAEGEGWWVIHLPTHEQHFYDVHRFEFDEAISERTRGSPHVMMLVEGTAVRLETAAGMEARFAYAETFVVPAGAVSYRLVNEGPDRASVVKAFMKDRDAWPEWMKALEPG